MMSMRFIGLAMLVLAAFGVVHAAADTIKLSAKDLFAGFDARRVLLDEQAGRLVLDVRAVKPKLPGIIETDPIDVIAPGAVVRPGNALLDSVAVAVAADVPEGAEAVVEVRTGPDPFDTSKSGQWTKLQGLSGKIESPAGPYFQIRITLKATSADKLPAVREVQITPVLTYQRIVIHPVKVVAADIQKIVRSPIEFHYERPDQQKVAAFRKAAKLDEAVAGLTDDFEKLVKLMDHVGSFYNDRKTRRETKNGVYQWDIDAVFQLVEGKPTVYGHCMTYAEVLSVAATAMGYVGNRHLCMVGFREASHEVCEMWVPSLGKWVYLDPSLTNYYYDLTTKTPMNLIEMHKVVADKFVPEGKDMHWWIQRNNAIAEETKARVREVGGKKHIGSRLGPWKYGEPMPADYDWGWSHGYLAAGFVQMTPRNDFHTNPQAMPRNFGHNPGYANFPVWVDAKTPPKTNNWYTRMRDFYWTLDQASVRLVQTGNRTIGVQLGNSMPFFKAYQIKVNGEAISGGVQTASLFQWELKAGENKLEVVPVDEFGKVGLPSVVTVHAGD